MENLALFEDLRQLKAMVKILHQTVSNYEKQVAVSTSRATQALELAREIKTKYQKEKKARDKYILKLQGKIKTLKNEPD